MEFSKFKIGNNDISRRLDKVIRIFADNLPLPEIYKAIRKGLIKVNNHKSKSEYRLQENDEIEIASFLVNKTAETKTNNLEKQKETDKKNEKENKSFNEIKNNMPEIVFKNDFVLIINKPYDINVHGDQNSLDKIICNYYEKTVHESSLSFKPGPLHRLDRKTTGLLIFSMNLEGARWVSDNIQNHNIQKKYWGLVNGRLSGKENWTDYIYDDENKTGFHKVIAKKIQDNKKNIDLNTVNTEKIAETVAVPLAYGTYENKPVTLVEFNIKTGRKHQIRSQSALHGHSLLGDTAYGSRKITFGNQDFYLTAKELNFPKDNPLNIPEHVTVNLPDEFINILKHCGIKKKVV